MTEAERERGYLTVRESLKMLDYTVLSDKSTEDDIRKQSIQCKAQIDLLDNLGGWNIAKLTAEYNKILSIS